MCHFGIAGCPLNSMHVTLPSVRHEAVVTIPIQLILSKSYDGAFKITFTAANNNPDVADCCLAKTSLAIPRATVGSAYVRTYVHCLWRAS